ncbi:ATP-dependent DNA helicase RecQ-like [Ruditapes philippinarum]|uniref:ATP-dependent DNA helicase RecQ-like n=1 Tax=Ruditapes philippinarum TaxID=129788 RepID=UPI00295B2B8C|nr:ATP-dependent DNA helicase RecQ-like [Ruditapes philippinarum]
MNVGTRMLAIHKAVEHFDPKLKAKPKQVECWEHVLAGKHVIVTLPVGYGKSLIYQVLPDLIRDVGKYEKPVVIVISPLNIIQSEQMDVLKRHNISSCKLSYFDEDGHSEIEQREFIQGIRNGEFSIVFAHPEALLNTNSGKDLLIDSVFLENVAAVVIDECHIVEEWGQEFRTAFSKLRTLPAIFENIPFLALSGTLTRKQMKKLPELLSLKNPVIVQDSPDRSNIFLEKVVKIKSTDSMEIYEDIFKKECESLHRSPTTYPITLMFMPLYYISISAAYLKHLFGTVDITTSSYAVLYSRQDKTVIQTTIEDLRSEKPRIRLVLTSSVAGMGFDPPSVERVIHARPPRNMSQYLQEIGRAGRRGQKSKAILYYNNRDVAKNIPGIQEDILEYCKNNNKCLREMLLAPFGFTKSDKKESCCSFCSGKNWSQITKPVLDEAGNGSDLGIVSELKNNPIIKVTGDNLDIYVRTDHKSLDKHKKDLHLFASNIIFSRIAQPHMYSLRENSIPLSNLTSDLFLPHGHYTETLMSS